MTMPKTTCRCTGNCRTPGCGIRGGPTQGGYCHGTHDLTIVDGSVISHPARKDTDPYPPTAGMRRPVCGPCLVGLTAQGPEVDVQGDMPIACSTTWTTVMQTARWRCRCTGTCGARHSTDLCWVRHGTWIGKGKQARRVRLIAAPADPTTDTVTAAGIPAASLHAWCQHCYDRAHRRAKQAAKAAAAGGTDTLFDL